MKHREPPKPIYYDNAAAGQCRYCGDPIYNAAGKIKTRANWHPHCLEEYKSIYWPGHTRKVVFKRDRGVCFVCGTQAPTLRGAGSDWHVDHVRPLIEAHGDLDFWRLPNLVTLCVPCHKAKTSIEATERAATRRQAKLAEGPTPPE